MSKASRRRKAAANKRRQQMAAQTNAGNDNAVTMGAGRRKVSFFKAPLFTYPELYFTVFVAGSPTEEKQFAEMFVQARCSKASTPEEADLVIFSGGPDVNPLLYGEAQHPLTRTDVVRDKRDVELYEYCVSHGIPMLGICRGAQFLHVMNGGKLYQDVNNHYGDHDIWDLKAHKAVRGISSVHHQMVRKQPSMEVIAIASGRSSVRIISPTEKEEGNTQDIEAFFYRDTCCLGIQGHPEYRGYSAFAKWSLDLVNQYFNENPDLTYVKEKEGSVGRCRIKPDLLAERLSKAESKEFN